MTCPKRRTKIHVFHMTLVVPYSMASVPTSHPYLYYLCVYKEPGCSTLWPPSMTPLWIPAVASQKVIIYLRSFVLLLLPSSSKGAAVKTQEKSESTTKSTSTKVSVPERTRRSRGSSSGRSSSEDESGSKAASSTPGTRNNQLPYSAYLQ